MIWINKGQEPKEWTEKRLTPNATYEAIPELRESLLKEQGYICAYCMRRIPVKDKKIDAKSKIEHIKSREKHEEMQMDYANMVICCPGCIDEKSLHCDASKGEKDLICSPLNLEAMKTISYTASSVEIRSSNSIYNTEINELLHLNISMLKDNRKAAWDGVHTQLNKDGWTAANVRKMLQKFKERDADGNLASYCGVIIYFLERKLRTLEKK